MIYRQGWLTQSGGTGKKIGFNQIVAFTTFALLVGCSSAKTVPSPSPKKDEHSASKIRTEGPAPITSASELGIDLPLKTTTLPNGLKVILVEDQTVPIVSYQTWYRVGSVDEHPGITGMSHLFEHLMFKGTEKFGPQQFFKLLEGRGAEVNAFTTRDYTVYYENFAPSLLEKVVEMEADRMTNLVLNEKVMNGEKAVVLEERRLRTENSPEGRMEEALWGLSFQAHPYHWPVIGYPQDVAGVKLDELLNYYHAHYQPRNAAIVITGAFRSGDVLKWIRQYYGTIAASEKPKRDIPNEPEQSAERRLTLYDQVNSERFAEAYHITSATQDDTYALDVLSNILFTGMNSRAYRAMVLDKDIVLGVGGSTYTPTYPGLFSISATMKPGIPTAKAEEMLDQLVRDVQASGVTDAEIRTAVRQLTVQLVDSVRTPYGMGMLIGTVDTILGDPTLFANDLAKYLKVTAADVQRVARKYMVPNNRSIVTLVPKK